MQCSSNRIRYVETEIFRVKQFISNDFATGFIAIITGLRDTRLLVDLHIHRPVMQGRQQVLTLVAVGWFYWMA